MEPECSTEALLTRIEEASQELPERERIIVHAWIRKLTPQPDQLYDPEERCIMRQYAYVLSKLVVRHGVLVPPFDNYPPVGRLKNLKDCVSEGLPGIPGFGISVPVCAPGPARFPLNLPYGPGPAPFPLHSPFTPGPPFRTPGPFPFAVHPAYVPGTAFRTPGPFPFAVDPASVPGPSYRVPGTPICAPGPFPRAPGSSAFAADPACVPGPSSRAAGSSAFAADPACVPGPSSRAAGSSAFAADPACVPGPSSRAAGTSAFDADPACVPGPSSRVAGPPPFHADPVCVPGPSSRGAGASTFDADPVCVPGPSSRVSGPAPPDADPVCAPGPSSRVAGPAAFASDPACAPGPSSRAPDPVARAPGTPACVPGLASFAPESPFGVPCAPAGADRAPEGENDAVRQGECQPERIPLLGKGVTPRSKKNKSPPSMDGPHANAFEDPEEIAKIIARSRNQTFPEFVASISRHTKDFGDALRTAMKSELSHFTDYIETVLSQRIKDLTEALDEQQNRELEGIKKDTEKWQIELSNVKKRIKEMIPTFDIDIYRKDPNYIRSLFSVSVPGFIPEEDSYKKYREESFDRLKWIQEMTSNFARFNEQARRNLANMRHQTMEFQNREAMKQQDIMRSLSAEIEDYRRLKAERDQLLNENNQLLAQETEMCGQ